MSRQRRRLGCRNSRHCHGLPCLRRRACRDRYWTGLPTRWIRHWTTTTWWGQFPFLSYFVDLIIVATALPARNCAAIAPVDRSGHHPAVSPWANGHAAWADADGDV